MVFGPLDKYLAAFAVRLETVGYGRPVCDARLSQARHFAGWILQSRIPVQEITDAAVQQFARHNCRCGIRTKRGRRVAGTGPPDRCRGARRFVDFLREQGVINPSVQPVTPKVDPRLDRFAQWLESQTRGNSRDDPALSTGSRTLDQLPRHGHQALRCSGHPFDRARCIFLNATHYSIRMTVTVLRTFLRFTMSPGLCAPFLLHAVPPAVRRKLSTVPRTIPAATIEDIIASCGATTPRQGNSGSRYPRPAGADGIAGWGRLAIAPCRHGLASRAAAAGGQKSPRNNAAVAARRG